ncbi:PhnD/SsuA/transferrin family substrate-binding protein [Falsiroseomonas sp. CW058]|uniref:PhnD/SsuA/transferrin family substrate-binding protein n=1 Tax=Falsiroseomonas sp. CW058 TaxID=3388664 RepID=UPI003D314386
MAAALPRRSGAQPAPLQFGVMPNVSTRILLAQYQHFRAFLESESGRAVEVVTAPGLQPFHQRTLAGAYGVVVTAANLARVAQLDAGMRPVAIYEPRIPGLLVARRDRVPADLGALRGRQVAMTNPQSLVALRFVRWLAVNAGLQVGRDVMALHARNEDSLVQLLTGPDTPLAVMSRGELNAIRPDLRETLVVWREFEQVPGFVVLLHPDLPAAEAARLEAALARFPRSEAGAAFFAATGFRDIRPIAPAEMEEIDPVVAETRALLGQP